MVNDCSEGSCSRDMSDENQHWVPKLLLKKFADTDGRVFRLDIHSSEVTKPPPKKAASSPGFNNFDIEGQIVSFEDRLEKVETKAAPVLKRSSRLGLFRESLLLTVRKLPTSSQRRAFGPKLFIRD